MKRLRPSTDEEFEAVNDNFQNNANRDRRSFALNVFRNLDRKSFSSQLMKKQKLAITRDIMNDMKAL